jgi:hypothetical protein
MSENDMLQKQTRLAYIRMSIGAIIGFMAFAAISTFYLWRGGWFNRVPMFTPPPGLIVFGFSSIGAAIGALLSLFSRKWNKET